MRKVGNWVRSRYGIRELVLPEKYRVDAKHGVVVTYSSCLALVYFANDEARLTLEDIARTARHAVLYDALREHPGIGLLAALDSQGVHVQSREGRGRIVDGSVTVLDGRNPLEPYGVDPLTVRAIEALVRQPNAGDIVLFGAYDGYEIVSFDDQVGAHGSAGGIVIRSPEPFALVRRGSDGKARRGLSMTLRPGGIALRPRYAFALRALRGAGLFDSDSGTAGYRKCSRPGQTWAEFS